MKFSSDEIIKIVQSALFSIMNPGKSVKPLPKKESAKYPEIYVFRHGETFDNRNKVFSGWRNSHLTPKGKKQAMVLAKKLVGKKIDICITSRLSRSKETAKIVFSGRKIRFEVDDRVIERDYGHLTGKSKNKLMKDDFIKAVKYRRFYSFRPPGGESLADVKNRIFPFCRDLVKRIRRTGENVAISCHGNSMKIIRLFFERLKTVDVIIQENPLGKDYVQYVVKPQKSLEKK